MRFKVPQNIDMPDRILGPLTLLQFVYAVVGGGLAYVSYMSLPSPLGLLVSVIVALFTLAVIFLKVNERPFTHFLLSAIRFFTTPHSRVWQKGESSDINVQIYHTEKTQGPVVPHKRISHEQIEQLAHRVDSNKTA